MTLILLLQLLPDCGSGSGGSGSSFGSGGSGRVWCVCCCVRKIVCEDENGNGVVDVLCAR